DTLWIRSADRALGPDAVGWARPTRPRSASTIPRQEADRMSQQPAAVAETLRTYAQWYPGTIGEEDYGTAQATASLADLLARAERVGADLHDPTPDLLGFLARDLARDGVVDDDYARAMAVISTWLLYLRQQRLWFRSERVVQWCWSALAGISTPPMGLTTLGSAIDDKIAELIALPRDPVRTRAVGLAR